MRLVNENKFKEIYTTSNIPSNVKIAMLKNIDQTFYSVDAFVTPIDYSIGMAYLQSNDYSGALPYFEKAYSINNTYFAVSNSLALTYVLNGNRDKALALYKRTLEAYPDNCQTLLNCALLYYQIKDYDHSRNYFDRIKEDDIKKYGALVQRYLMLKKALASVNPTARSD